jgi:hypothetical protein
MTNLPPGWWVKNTDGSFNGPPPIEEPDDQQDGDDMLDEDGNHDSDSAPEEEMGLDIRPDSPGWEDVEADTEDLKVQCLLCPQQNQSAQAMTEHCQKIHGFDFIGSIKRHDLDFYGTIKYINLIRTRVKQGNPEPTTIAPSDLTPEELGRPVLEDDALLFTLDEIVSFEDDSHSHAVNGVATSGNG